MLRIGMLTSGGDCQALNATMRGVVKGLSANVQELEVYGFYDGYKGLIYGNPDAVCSNSASWPLPCPVRAHPVYASA